MRGRSNTRSSAVQWEVLFCVDICTVFAWYTCLYIWKKIAYYGEPQHDRNIISVNVYHQIHCYIHLALYKKRNHQQEETELETRKARRQRPRSSLNNAQRESVFQSTGSMFLLCHPVLRATLQLYSSHFGADVAFRNVFRFLFPE